MAGAVGTNVVKDGNGAAIVGGVRMFDISGTGAGPWIAMQLPADQTGAAIDLTAASQVVGNVAHDAVDSLGPVKVGGIASNSRSAVSVGDRVDAHFSLYGDLGIMASDYTGGEGNDSQNLMGFGNHDHTGQQEPTSVGDFVYVGTRSEKWDRVRGTHEPVVLASSARTTAQSVDFKNRLPGARLHLIVNVTAYTASASLTPIIRAKDPTAGDYYTLLTGAAIVATGKYVFRIGVGLTAAANLVVNDMLPRNLNFQMTVTNANSCTYSVDAILA